MKNYQSPGFKELAGRLSIMISLLMLAAGTVLAQGPPAGMGGPPVINPKGETDAQTNREATLRSAEMGATSDQAYQRQLVAAIERTRQDFKRIQLIRNDMIDELLSSNPLDYKRIAEQTSEINKRALRLKLFMVPVTSEEKKQETANKVEWNGEELKGGLVRLCNLIRSFTGNPMFKNLGTLDLKESARARNDLLAIIEISENARESAVRLSKTTK